MAINPWHRSTYTVPDAARFIPGLAPSTLRSWVKGRPYPTAQGEAQFEPLIHVPDLDDGRLSFTNLVEAYVLHALRTRHKLSMGAVRTALRYARDEMGLERPLARPDLLVTPGNLFLERYGELINLSRAGQLAMKKILEGHLQRIEFAPDGTAIRFFPPSPVDGSSREIVIDPRVSFGRPILERRGVRAETLAERVDIGEAVDDIAEDYGLDREEVERAVAFAHAA